MSAKIAVSSSITWLIGWMRPRVSGPSRTGSVTSMRSAARRCSSAASASASLRVAIAPWTLSRRPLMSGPFSLRSSGVMAPSVFRSSETAPFLPSAETRTASSAASSGAPSTCAEQVPFEGGEIGHRVSAFARVVSVAGPDRQALRPQANSRRLGRAAGRKASEGLGRRRFGRAAGRPLKLRPRAPAATLLARST